MAEQEGQSRPQTIGEARVRAYFNPSASGVVDQFKNQIGALIDQVYALRDLDPRLASMAMTSLEEACMWAVKLATTQK